MAGIGSRYGKLMVGGGITLKKIKDSVGIPSHALFSAPHLYVSIFEAGKIEVRRKEWEKRTGGIRREGGTSASSNCTRNVVYIDALL